MHQQPTSINVPTPAATFSLQEVAEILIKAANIHEGIYELSMDFTIGVGAVGPAPDSVVPGVVVGISKFGLMPTATPTPLSVDAAIVNPKKATRKTVSNKQ